MGCKSYDAGVNLTKEEELVDETLVVQTRSKGHVSQTHMVIAQAPKKTWTSTPLTKPCPSAQLCS
jgi:hypothetical protein